MNALGSMIFAAAAALALAGAGPVAAAPAKAAAAPKFSPRDFTGVWMNDKTEAGPYPYNAEFSALYAKRRADDAAGKPYDDPAGRCITSGMPAVIAVGAFPWEIFQASTHMTMLKENGGVRRIRLDRGHADDGPLYMGDSIGRWEGDTLVVETVGLRGDTVLERRLALHSDAMKIVERISRPSFDTLVFDMTIDDPKAFVEPYKVKVTMKRHDDWELKEYICQDNNRYTLGGDGVARIVMPPPK